MLWGGVLGPLAPTEPCPSVLSLLSLAVHPDMVTIATGQVAGTTKEGKVTNRGETSGPRHWSGVLGGVQAACPPPPP